MAGEPIEALNNGIQMLIAFLRQDPFALETVHISIITFDSTAKVILPLTSIETLMAPELKIPSSGATHLGQALELLCQQVDKDRILSSTDIKGDWKPLLLIFTDGSPSDLQTYREYTNIVKAKNFGLIWAIAAGPKAKTELLKELTDNVFSLDTMETGTMKQFFQWVSTSVSSGNKSMGTTDEVQLPPPPPTINQVI